MQQKDNKMSIDIDFGTKIKRLIESKGHTYEEAATIVGSNRSTVNRWARQKDIDTSILKKICYAYKIPMSYFLSESSTYTMNNQGQSGGINAVGEKIIIINYTRKEQSEGVSDKENADYKILIERLRSCEEKNELLQKMVSILEKK